MKSKVMRLVIIKEDEVHVYGSLTTVCKNNKELRYHTLKDKKFPFVYKGWRFFKVEYNK